MKIFKKEGNDIDNSYSLIRKLLDNDYSLEEKMKNLIKSYKEIKLIKDGERELLELLFSSLSLDIYFPRIGDNSERYDALVSFENYKAIVEVEIPSNAILDAPRNLIDDYCVLKSRNKTEIKNFELLVICWDLPNKRTDYWNVIYDISEVLNLRVKTISVLAIAVHFWLNLPLSFLSDDYFLHKLNFEMTPLIKELNSKNICLDNFKGYFFPFK